MCVFARPLQVSADEAIAASATEARPGGRSCTQSITAQRERMEPVGEARPCWSARIRFVQVRQDWRPGQACSMTGTPECQPLQTHET